MDNEIKSDSAFISDNGEIVIHQNELEANKEKAYFLLYHLITAVATQTTEYSNSIINVINELADAPESHELIEKIRIKTFGSFIKINKAENDVMIIFKELYDIIKKVV